MKITDKKFWTYALERALRTFLQVAVAMLPASATLFTTNWIGIIGVAGYSFITSLATSLIWALPEHEAKEDVSKIQQELEYWKNHAEKLQNEKSYLIDSLPVLINNDSIDELKKSIMDGSLVLSTKNNNG